MAVTLKIRKGNASEERGEVTREQAIGAFRDYPWEEEIKKAQADIAPVFPVMAFISPKNGELNIQADGPDFQVTLLKDKKTGEEFVSTDKTVNPSGTSVEDFIAAFFDGDLHEHLKMGAAVEEDDPEAKQAWSFSGKSKVPFLLSPAILLLITGWLVKEHFQGKTIALDFLLAYCAIMLVCIPFSILFLHYLKHDRNRIVKVDRGKKTVTIAQNGASVSFGVKDIEAARIFTGRSPYAFILFKLKNGKRYSITNFTVAPETIAETLGIRTEHVEDFYPWVPADSPF